MHSNQNNWHEKSLRLKITVIFSLAIFIAIAGSSLYTYQQYKTHLITTQMKQLKSIRSAKSRQIENYFKHIRNQIETFSESTMVIDATKEFRLTYNALPSIDAKSPLDSEYERGLYEYYKKEFIPRIQSQKIDTISVAPYTNISSAAKYLQYHYIFSNPNPTAQKEKLSFAADKSEYSRTHQRYHPLFNNYLTKFGYHDIFIIAPNSGNILYSVTKEVDYGTSLLTGPYKDSHLGQLFQEIRASNKKEFVKLTDFKPYLPSHNQPASFIGSPIYDGKKKVGILIFQMPIDKINHIMTSDKNWYLEGLGYSGETILVGSDHKMRSQSRGLIEHPAEYFKALEKNGESKHTINRIKQFKSAILFQTVESTITEKALNGAIGEDIIKDYRNKEVLVAYLPLNIVDVQWAFIAKYDLEELLGELLGLRLNTLMAALIFLLLFFSFTLYFSRNISLPFESLKRYSATLLENKNFHPANLSHHALAHQLGANLNSIGNAIDRHVKSINQLLSGQSLTNKRDTFNPLDSAAQDLSHHINAISSRYSKILTTLIEQNQLQNLRTNEKLRNAQIEHKTYQQMNSDIATAARENKLIATINEKITQQVGLFLEQQRELEKELKNVNCNVEELMNEHVHRDLMKRYIKEFGTTITTMMRRIRKDGNETTIGISSKLKELDQIFKRMDAIYNEHFDIEYTKILLISKEIRKISVYFEVQNNREALIADISNELKNRIQLQYDHLAALNETVTKILNGMKSQEMTEEQMSSLLTKISCACIQLEDHYGEPPQTLTQENDASHRKAS